MVDPRNALELVQWARQTLANAEPLATPVWLDTFWAALGAVVVGLILAMWGGRILRSVIILASMTAGAVVGKQMANTMQIDLLIGLVIGAGIAGLMGYVFYRWWLALTVGVVVTLLMVLAFSAPRLLNERQGFEDFRLGVGSGRYDTSRQAPYTVDDVRRYFWEQKRDVVLKTLGPVAVLGVLAFIVGLMAPRLASIVGTSALGVLLLTGGAGMLIASKWPEGWKDVEAHTSWALGGVVVFWLFFLLYQFTHPTRPAVVVSAAPAPAPAA